MIKCKLISHTPESEKVVSIAAKLCYSKSDVDGLITGVLTGNDTEKFIDKLKGMGHESPLEHVSFTFAIEGVSRTLTHQLGLIETRVVFELKIKPNNALLQQRLIETRVVFEYIIFLMR